MNKPSSDMWDKILSTFKDALSKAESAYIRKATSTSSFFRSLCVRRLTRLQALTARPRRTTRHSLCCENAPGLPCGPRSTNRRPSRLCSSSSSSSSRIASATTTRASRGCGSLTMISMRFSRRPRTTFVPPSSVLSALADLTPSPGPVPHPPLLQYRPLRPHQHLHPPLLGRFKRPREPRIRLSRHAHHPHRFEGRRPLRALQA